ncbi:MAG: hypothetical protein ACOZJZ_21275 [Pseudomonadota bacterium]
MRSLATGGAPAYELRGRSLLTLEQQAQGLCRRGYSVVRQWERQRRAEAGAGAAGGAAGWTAALDWLRPSEADQAQMTVQCRGG